MTEGRFHWIYECNSGSCIFRNCRHFRYVAIWFLVVAFFALTQAGALGEKNNDTVDLDGAIDIDGSFIRERVYDLCSQTLYSARDVYDTGHFMMLPMRYGFKTRDSFIIDCFAEMFDRFVYDQGEDRQSFNEFSGLNRNHWLYLMSEYMCYCVDYEVDFDPEIFYSILDYMIQYNNTYTKNFDGEIKYSSFQSLLEGLLYGSGYGREDSLNYCITDNDTFPISIICDLQYVKSRMNFETENDDFLIWGRDSAEAMLRTFAKEDQCGGWIFQPGVWKDYKDYRYAGYATIAEIDPSIEKRIEGIGSDSSHFTRWACFINSYGRVIEDQALYTKLKTGLANTMCQLIFEKTEESDGYYVLRNYMDGTNGVYRYNEEKGSGYDAYQLSTTFLNGWWSMLEDERITEIYRDTYDKLRYETELPPAYVDPLTTRERNPLYTSIENYQMLTYIASLGLY